MSRAPPPGGPGSMPFDTRSRPPPPQDYRQPPPQGHRQPPPQDYRQPPSQGHRQPPPQDRRQLPPQGHRQQGYANSGEEPPARRVSLLATKVFDKSLHGQFIYGNKSAVCPQDFPPKPDGSDHYILLRVPSVGNRGDEGQFVVTARPIQGIEPGRISLSEAQRSWMRVSLTDNLTGELFDPFAKGGQAYLGTIDLEIGFASANANKTTEKSFDEDDLISRFIKICKHDVLQPMQRILMDVGNIPLLIVVKSVGLTDLSMSSKDTGNNQLKTADARGILTELSVVSFHTTGAHGFDLNQSVSKPSTHALLAPDFKFEQMGIGGLDKEFEQIFRRAFASRLFDQKLTKQLGIKNVKGMLLYGPPGTGKTLIARQIGKMLNAHPPKVVNGPEVLNKFVGQSEENIRKLFADAEKEHKEKPNNSGLHIIIFDELDAICKQRGSSAGGSGVGDGLVNQLLTMLDGVNQLPNILLIGMTNRKDLIDSALLRPGRLEVHVEISLADEAGRLQILRIHTASMREHDFLGSDVDLEELAHLTKNYSGAELMGLLNSASSFAMMRHVDAGEGIKVKSDAKDIKLHRYDFMEAMKEITPAYGVSESSIQEAIEFGIIKFDPVIDSIIEQLSSLFEMMREDPQTTNMSVLFHGTRGSGKSALAAHCALRSEFLYVNTIRPSDLVAFSHDTSKKDHLHKIFDDAYKSQTSLLILEDFDRLIEWIPIGPRFSTTILGALTNMIAKPPPKGHSLFIIATTSNYEALVATGADKDFMKKIEIPVVRTFEELQSIFVEMDVPEAQHKAILSRIHEQTGSHYVGVGVKVVIRCVRESQWKAARGWDIVETLAQAIVTEVRHGV